MADVHGLGEDAAVAEVPPLPDDFEPELKPARPITLRLVMENSLNSSELAEFGTLGAEEAEARSKELKTIHLEWQGISEIINLEAFEGVEVLYLQRNHIRRIEGLESMLKLQFLALQNNQISEVENLLHLRELEFLDLSGNKIETLSDDQLPESINILNMKGNPCRSTAGYEDRLLARLPNLVHLDGRELVERTGEEPDVAQQPLRSVMPQVKGVEPLPPDNPEEIALAGGEKGLSAYWRKDEMRNGMTSAISEKIEAYAVEMLADVDGLGRRCEDMVERSRARQQRAEVAPSNASLSASLTEKQLAEVKRLSASLRQKQAEEAGYTGQAQ